MATNRVQRVLQRTRRHRTGKRQNDVLRDHKEMIVERLQRNLAVMKSLPAGSIFSASNSQASRFWRNTNAIRQGSVLSMMPVYTTLDLYRSVIR